MTMTRITECSAPTGAGQPTLLIACELGQRTWKLGFSRGLGDRPRVRTMAAGALETVRAEIATMRQQWQLPAETRVVSCYEAGRDGFWLHRWLVTQGITNYVVDSASIEVNRRAKRVKTDRVDLGGLLALLARYLAGDHRAWRIVRVPTLAQEDTRQWHRQREALQRDRTRVINRIKGVLATLGVRLAVTRSFGEQLDQARLWDGAAIPPGAYARLLGEWHSLQAMNAALTVHERRVTDGIDVPTTTAMQKLATLRGIGPVGARVLSTEVLAWRQVRNGRELGAFVGLVPGRYQSGDTTRDLGITRAGNVHVRRISVQLAWVWVQYQRDSALTQWYQRRFATGSTRVRRIGIVALARKLLIALWRFVDHDVVPEGAHLKRAVA